MLGTESTRRDAVLKEVRLTLDEARVRTLLLINVGGEVCLDLKLHGDLQRGGARWRRRKRSSRACSPSRRLCFDRASRSALWRDRDLVSNFSAGVQLPRRGAASELLIAVVTAVQSYRA